MFQVNDLHVKILELITEIDSICRKYDITYYAAGGTTIGAVRHHGFIPWDDDIDIYMTRNEFKRFREAFEKEHLPDRILECLENNPEYPGTIPRYINTATTDLCRFHCLNTCAGGILIDIFILDPIPSEKEIQDHYRALLNVYADYVMPYYAFSYRNDSKYLSLYFQYQELEEKIGRDGVIKKLETELFSYDENDCEFYMLRWATLPSIFNKNMFGTPVYIEFENIKLPVPSQWYQYLKQLYGFDWMYIPQNVENQIQHVAVINPELSYINYTKELDEFINKTSAKKVYQKRKIDLLTREILDRPFQEKFLNLKAKAVSKALENAISSCDSTLDKLLADKKYIDILEMADHYLTTQLSPVYAGKMKHGNWYRYKNPIYIPIKDETFSVIIYSLIACNEIKKAERLIEIRKSSVKDFNQSVIEIEKLLINISDLYEKYYTHNYDVLVEILNKFSTKDQTLLPVLQIKYLYQSEVNSNSDFKQQITDDIKTYPPNSEFYKAYADYLFNNQEIELAKTFYTKAFSFHNGVLNLNIKEKMPDVQAQDSVSSSIRKYSLGEHYTEQICTKQKELLNEIHNICIENGITYSLMGDTALFAQYEHRLSRHRYINTILMTPNEALKFIKAFDKTKKPNRFLDYMTTNSMHIGDDIYYGDTSASYVNINTLYNMKTLGLFVRIAIVRPKKLSINSTITNALEAARTVNCSLDKPNETIKSQIIKTGSDIIIRCIGKKNLDNIVFHRIYTQQKNNSKLYYTTKRKRLRNRTLNVYSKHVLENVSKCRVEDINLYISDEIEELGWLLDDNKEETFNEKNMVNSLWVFSSTDIGYSEIKDIINVKELTQSKEWTNHIKSKSYSQKVKSGNKKIRRYWQILLRADDRITLWKKYESLKDTILKYYEARDYVHLSELFYDLDEAVKRYSQMNLGFYFVSDVFDIYYKWLEKTGCEDIELYKKLIPDYYKQPIKLF